MDQLHRVTLIIVITVYKVIEKLITKIDFQYRTDVNKKSQEGLSATGNRH